MASGHCDQTINLVGFHATRNAVGVQSQADLEEVGSADHGQTTLEMAWPGHQETLEVVGLEHQEALEVVGPGHHSPADQILVEAESRGGEGNRVVGDDQHGKTTLGVDVFEGHNHSQEVGIDFALSSESFLVAWCRRVEAFEKLILCWAHSCVER